MASIKTEIFVLCDYATVSREQKVSILGIFEQYVVNSIPSALVRMFLVAVFKGEPQKEYDLTLKIIPPQKTEQEFPNKDVKVTLGPNGKANMVTELVNFPIPLLGKYKMQIVQKSKIVGELELEISKTTATYSGR